MSTIDPAERARREEAVRVVRGFAPVYAGLTALLFSAPLARILGLPAPSGFVQSLWSGGALLGLFLAAAWLIVRLSGMGQYRMGQGLKFDLFAAVWRGVYVPVGGSVDAGVVATSPADVLRADVQEIEAALGEKGDPVLAETVRAGLGEAENVMRLLDRLEPAIEGLPIAEARARVGRFADHVLALRTDLMKGQAGSPEHAARFDADLRDLRDAGDALRRGPAPASTGTG